MARIWNTPVFILANATLGDFFATLSFASAFRRPGNYPRAGKTFGGIFVGNRSFLRRRCHLHYGRSFETHVRRAVVST